MNYSVVILAAGKGERTELGYNKVLYKIDDKTIIEHTRDVFLNDEDCSEIILVVAKHEIDIFEKYKVGKTKLCIGGSTRQESVYYGIQDITNDMVMIHDGARPYVEREMLISLKETMQKERACLLMVPVIDTIKVIKDGYVEQTPNRDTLYAAQTPQCFETKLLLECHEIAKKEHYIGSDDTQLVERYTNVKIKVVKGDYCNKKITTKEDIR